MLVMAKAVTAVLLRFWATVVHFSHVLAEFLSSSFIRKLHLRAGRALFQAALQSVCEALLHGGHRNASLLSLPSIWLDQLLHQLTGETQEVSFI